MRLTPLAALFAAGLLAAPRGHAAQPDVNNPATYTATSSGPVWADPAPPVSLDLSLASVHFPARLSGQPRFNDWNPGVGLEAPLSPDLTSMAGVYRNSYRRASLYAGLAYTPWAWQPCPGLTLRPGAIVGLVSGYSRDENPAAPLFGAGLLQVRLDDGLGLNLIGLPRMDGQAGFIGLQLVVPVSP